MQTAGLQRCANPLVHSRASSRSQVRHRADRVLTQAGLFGLGAPSKSDISTRKQQVRLPLQLTPVQYSAQVISVIIVTHMHAQPGGSKNDARLEDSTC